MCAFCQAAKGLPARRRSIFYLLDAYALLREQYFRLGFLLSNRVLGRSPASLFRRFRSKSLARNPYAKALVNAMAFVSRLRMRLACVVLLVTSVAKRTPSAGCPIPPAEHGQSGKGTTGKSMPKKRALFKPNRSYRDRN